MQSFIYVVPISETTAAFFRTTVYHASLP